jgi:hypothetical protein
VLTVGKKDQIAGFTSGFDQTKRTIRGLFKWENGAIRTEDGPMIVIPLGAVEKPGVEFKIILYPTKNQDRSETGEPEAEPDNIPPHPTEAQPDHITWLPSKPIVVPENCTLLLEEGDLTLFFVVVHFFRL